MKLNNKKYESILEDIKEIHLSTLEKELKHELTISILASMATEFVLDVVYDTFPEVSYEADKFAEETHTLRMPYMKLQEEHLMMFEKYVYKEKGEESVVYTPFKLNKSTLEWDALWDARYGVHLITAGEEIGRASCRERV